MENLQTEIIVLVVNGECFCDDVRVLGEIERLLVRALLGALCCLLEQDWDLKHQVVQNKANLMRHVLDYRLNIFSLKYAFYFLPKKLIGIFFL